MQESHNNTGAPSASKRQLYFAIKFFLRFVVHTAEENCLGFYRASGPDIVSKNYERVLRNLEPLGTGLKEGESTQKKKINDLNWQEENVRRQK